LATSRSAKHKRRGKNPNAFSRGKKKSAVHFAILLAGRGGKKGVKGGLRLERIIIAHHKGGKRKKERERHHLHFRVARRKKRGSRNGFLGFREKKKEVGVGIRSATAPRKGEGEGKK